MSIQTQLESHIAQGIAALNTVLDDADLAALFKPLGPKLNALAITFPDSTAWAEALIGYGLGHQIYASATDGRFLATIRHPDGLPGHPDLRQVQLTQRRPDFVGPAEDLDHVDLLLPQTVDLDELASTLMAAGQDCEARRSDLRPYVTLWHGGHKFKLVTCEAWQACVLRADSLI
ncbi:MAG TPA: hypothetical protein VLI05_06160 [Candidatus Saccharimonadia bacterium]|nr:hypothetical protein [Candidatus Saccharimonadia bacterium]